MLSVKRLLHYPKIYFSLSIICYYIMLYMLYIKLLIHHGNTNTNTSWKNNVNIYGNNRL